MIIFSYALKISLFLLQSQQTVKIKTHFLKAGVPFLFPKQSSLHCFLEGQKQLQRCNAADFIHNAESDQGSEDILDKWRTRAQIHFIKG